MDYGYATTSYGAQGGAGGGGFMPGSQNESPSAKRSYGKETLRPVTIKQLIEAYHPNPDADHFMIDEHETTQVTFVGQIRNISTQTTNVTYKLDDGTGIIEVKVWIDAEALNNPEEQTNDKKLTDQAYARVFGRLKVFSNRRHVGANIIRPIKDYNEVQYHLLEATYVHLHFSRGPPESGQAAGGANGANGGHQQNQQNGQGLTAFPPGLSKSAKIVYDCMRQTPQTNEGLHMMDIATRTGLEVTEVLKAGDDMLNAGVVYTTVDDQTWAIMEL